MEERGGKKGSFSTDKSMVRHIWSLILLHFVPSKWLAELMLWKSIFYSKITSTGPQLFCRRRHRIDTHRIWSFHEKSFVLQDNYNADRTQYFNLQFNIFLTKKRLKHESYISSLFLTVAVVSCACCVWALQWWAQGASHSEITFLFVSGLHDKCVLFFNCQFHIMTHIQVQHLPELGIQ